MPAVSIYMATHTLSTPPQSRPYLPLLVGAQRFSQGIPENMANDCTGENISQKNSSFCELTGLYWIWKNVSADIVGLVHYRRFLAPASGAAARPLTEEEILGELANTDCLIAKKEYFDSPVAIHYNQFHLAEDLQVVERAIAALSPEFLPAFKHVLKGNSFSPYNIIITRKETFDTYCAWLFSILAECEASIDPFSCHPNTQMRVFGYLAERLLNVWLLGTGTTTKEFPLWSSNEQILENSIQRHTPRKPLFETVPGSAPSDDESRIQSNAAGIRCSDAEEYIDYLCRCPKNNEYVDRLLKKTFEEARKDGVYGRGDGRVNVHLQLLLNNHPELRQGFSSQDSACTQALLKLCVEHGKELLSENRLAGITTRDGIDYSPLYDYEYYLSHYDDVPDDYFDSDAALAHFIEKGMPEGRCASARFDVERFKSQHGFLAKLYRNNWRKYYLHYLKHDARKKNYRSDYRYLA